ncbi:V4R domain protein [uncultured archaeon]|nr:V4R domain protein [uncultured archaeon]
MPQLFDLFKYAKLLNISDGNIKVWNIPMNIIPTFVLRDHQKSLIEDLGYRKTFERIYKSTKSGSAEYNKNFIASQGFTDKRKIIDWQSKIVSLSGWGTIEVAKIDFENDEYIAHFKENPFAKYYGKAKYPIDFFICGFIAGGFSASIGKELECFETQCVAQGKPYCEFIVGPKKVIDKKREALWKSLKV